MIISKQRKKPVFSKLNRFHDFNINSLNKLKETEILTWKLQQD